MPAAIGDAGGVGETSGVAEAAAEPVTFGLTMGDVASAPVAVLVVALGFAMGVCSGGAMIRSVNPQQ